MSGLVQTSQPSMNLRPSIGLLLSIGLPPESTRNYPKKLDHFRAKTGQMDQYRAAAEKFHAEYGPEPKVVDDLFFLSNAIGDVLDVRRKVWGQSGLKAISLTNFATYPPDEFRARIDAWDDELLTFPDDQKDPGRYQLKGPDDPVIAKTKMKVYATLRVALPRVTGIGTVVEISTTGRRSTDNLYASLVYADGIVRGNLIGVPFRLSVRPARMRYWDEKAKKRSTTDFFELVLDTPLTMAEMFEEITTRRQALAGAERLALPPVNHADLERDREHIDPFFSDNEEREVDAVLANAEPPASEPPDDGDEPEVVEAEELSFDQLAAEAQARRAALDEASS